MADAFDNLEKQGLLQPDVPSVTKMDAFDYIEYQQRQQEAEDYNEGNFLSHSWGALKGLTRGAVEAIPQAIDTVESGLNWLDNLSENHAGGAVTETSKVKAEPLNFDAAEDAVRELKPELTLRQESMASDFAEPIGQFLMGFALTRTPMGGSAGTATRIAKDSLAAGTADATFFDDEEGLMLEFLNDMPALDPFISDGILVGEDNPEWQNRTKKFLRSTVGGGMADVLFTAAFKHIRKTRGHDVSDVEVDPEVIQKAVDELPVTPQTQAIKDKVATSVDINTTDVANDLGDEATEATVKKPNASEGIYTKTIPEDEVDGLIQAVIDGPEHIPVKSNRKVTPENAFNFDRITDSEDVLKGIQAIGEKLDINNIPTEKFDKLIKDSAALFDDSKGISKVLGKAQDFTKVSDEVRRHMLAARVLMQQSMGEIQELLPKIKAGASIEDMLRFRQLIQVSGEAQKIVKAMKTSAGRDLNSLNIRTTRFDTVDLTDLEQVNIEHGNARKIAEEIDEKFQKASKEVDKSEAVKKSKRDYDAAQSKATEANRKAKDLETKARDLRIKADDMIEKCNRLRGKS